MNVMFVVVVVDITDDYDNAGESGTKQEEQPLSRLRSKQQLQQSWANPELGETTSAVMMTLCDHYQYHRIIHQLVTGGAA